MAAAFAFGLFRLALDDVGVEVALGPDGVTTEGATEEMVVTELEAGVGVEGETEEEEEVAVIVADAVVVVVAGIGAVLVVRVVGAIAVAVAVVAAMERGVWVANNFLAGTYLNARKNKHASNPTNNRPDHVFPNHSHQSSSAYYSISLQPYAPLPESYSRHKL